LQDVNGLVTVVEAARHGLVDGDVVRITEVEGMTELNGKEFKVAVKSPYSFTIGDTTKFGAYKKGGFVEQIKTPVELEFKPLAEFFGKNVDFGDKLIADKYERIDLYPFVVQGLLAFRESSGQWPTPGSAVPSLPLFLLFRISFLQKEHANRVVDLVEAIYTKASADNKVDDASKKWIHLIAKHCAGVISPMCAAFGGIIGQEIIKAVSSKYTPIKQFFFNDSIECLPSNDLNEDDCKPQGNRYDGQVPSI
jgi:ubiquitin-activating enzyme E1